MRRADNFIRVAKRLRHIWRNSSAVAPAGGFTATSYRSVVIHEGNPSSVECAPQPRDSSGRSGMFLTMTCPSGKVRIPMGGPIPEALRLMDATSKAGVGAQEKAVAPRP